MSLACSTTGTARAARRTTAIGGALLLAAFGTATQAGDLKNAWYAGFADPSNTTLAAFSEVTATYSDGIQYVVDFHDSPTSGVSAANTQSSFAYSSTSLGELHGFASAIGAGGADFSYGQVDSGWRDFLQVSGGTGEATMKVVGHFDGTLTGTYAALSSTSFVFPSAGSSNMAGGAFVMTNGSMVDATQIECTPELLRTCSVSLSGDSFRFEYEMTVTFTYGADILVASVASGFVDSGGSGGGSSALDFMSTSKVDYFVLPDGAQLTSAAAGAMVFNDGAWSYAPAAVPEPQTYALMLGGLALLSRLRARSVGRRSEC